MNKRRLIISLFACSIAGFFLGYISNQSKPVVGREIRDNSSEYTYINPLIAVSLGSKDIFPEYKPLGSQISSYIDGVIKDKKATDVSAYFRDINTGKWTGVNETVPYAPASMLKVVVMLAYLDHAEDDSSILAKQLSYTHAPDFPEYFKSPRTLAPGAYSVEKLIESMIVDSDNDALTALLTNDQTRVDRVNKALRLPLPTGDLATNDYMSAQQYSMVFRTLYNATYLSRNVSEQALDLLTKTSFMNGLVAGVPSNIKVAHKFGERTALNVNKQPISRELHDCGIIYAPTKPYFLCVMTKGDNFDNLAGVIAGISQLVYTSVK